MCPGAPGKAERGELLFGTVDSWLIWKLTRGRVHATDVTNASRTMLFDIRRLDWDETLLQALRIPLHAAGRPPEQRRLRHLQHPGRGNSHRGRGGRPAGRAVRPVLLRPRRGQEYLRHGLLLLMNTGETPCVSRHGLVTTIAAGLGGHVTYALEGSVFVGGPLSSGCATKCASSARQATRSIMRRRSLHRRRVFCPGLYGPRCAVLGYVRPRGHRRHHARHKAEHIIRAAQESIAYQSMDLVAAMEKDTGVPLRELRVDGGRAAMPSSCSSRRTCWPRRCAAPSSARQRPSARRIWPGSPSASGTIRTSCAASGGAMSLPAAYDGRAARKKSPRLGKGRRQEPRLGERRVSGK